MNKILPFFKDFVPGWLRVTLFVLFAIVFQCANPVYLSLMGDIVGANQIYKEDLTFVYQVSTIGVTFIFPLLFRIKFRFTSQQILSVCSVLLALLLLVCAHTSSIPVLLLCAFFIGVLKMIGTFETLVSIQLVITQHKDYGMFFSVALGIVLLSAQVSSTLAILLADRYEWEMIYYLVAVLLALQALVILVLLRPFRIAKLLPLVGIDWMGIFHWTILFSLLSYVLTYGRVLDWYTSEKIVVATIAGSVWLLLVLHRTYHKKRSLLLPHVFRLTNVNVAIIIILAAQLMLNTTGSVLGPFTSSVMGLDNLHIGGLNWWIAAGILVGAAFGYWWFKYINGPFRTIFALGFVMLTLHHVWLYFSFDSSAGEQQLYIPYFFKGFGNIIIFAGAGKYMTLGVGLDIFTQMLCYMAMFRNALGNTVMGAIINENAYARLQDYHQKLSSKMDASGLQPLWQQLYGQALKRGFSSFEASQISSKLIYGRVSHEAMLLAGKDIFGSVSVFGLFVLAAIGTYHFSAPVVKSFPSWRRIFLAVRRS
jgi:DHA2 family multidrug resistance protein